MFTIYGIFSKNRNILTTNHKIWRCFNFWRKSQKSDNSSNSVVKANDKISLAYYGLDANYLGQSKPNPILFYHNLFTSKEMYENIAKPLAQQTERAVYLLDMRNHGESPSSDAENSTITQMAKDVIDFMDEFAIKKAVLVGHGVGSLAMLRAGLLYEDRVEKVAAIDITPIDLPLFGSKVVDHMMFTLSSLPKNMNLSFARLIVKKQLNRFFRDKTLLQYILLNLRSDDKGFIKWRFNLPVIRQLLIRGIDRTMPLETQYSGDVLIVSGKYGSMTASNYSQLKNSFPNSKFDFYQRFRHYIGSERPKQLVNVLLSFVNKTNDKTHQKSKTDS